MERSRRKLSIKRLRAVLGREFVTERRGTAGLFDTPPESFDLETAQFEINVFDGNDMAFIASLQRLSGATVSAAAAPAPTDQAA